MGDEMEYGTIEIIEIIENNGIIEVNEINEHSGGQPFDLNSMMEAVQDASQNGFELLQLL